MHKEGDKVGDGSEEGNYGDTLPGSSISGSHKPFEKGSFSYFEIFVKTGSYSVNQRPVSTHLPFVLARGYVGGTTSKLSGKQENTDMNPQTFVGARDIGDLVDKYVAANGYCGDKLFPVRNRDASLSSVRYSPLTDAQMTEFKEKLKTQDLERYVLSFPED